MEVFCDGRDGSGDDGLRCRVVSQQHTGGRQPPHIRHPARRGRRPSACCQHRWFLGDGSQAAYAQRDHDDGGVRLATLLLRRRLRPLLVHGIVWRARARRRGILRSRLSIEHNVFRRSIERVRSGACLGFRYGSSHQIEFDTRRGRARGNRGHCRGDKAWTGSWLVRLGTVGVEGEA